MRLVILFGISLNLIYLAIFTGCRREEILGFEWRDFDFENCEIKIRRSSQYTSEDGIFEDDLKTRKSIRNCFVPKKVIKIIEEYKEYWNSIKDNAIENNDCNETERLFIQENGKPMFPDTPGSWFRKFLKRKKLPLTRLHDLRHYVELYIKGIPLLREHLKAVCQ